MDRVRGPLGKPQSSSAAIAVRRPEQTRPITVVYPYNILTKLVFHLPELPEFVFLSQSDCWMPTKKLLRYRRSCTAKEGFGASRNGVSTKDASMYTQGIGERGRQFVGVSRDYCCVERKGFNEHVHVGDRELNERRGSSLRRGLLRFKSHEYVHARDRGRRQSSLCRGSVRLS